MSSNCTPQIYVETGELGKLAFKPKEQGGNEEDLEEDNICELVIVESQKVAATVETERQIVEHVSNSSGITKEEKMLVSASTGEQTSLYKHTSDQHKGAELSSSNLSEAMGSELKEKDAKIVFFVCAFMN